MDWGTCLDNGVATLDCVPVLFTNIVNAALEFAGSVALILIIWAGILYITAGGDAKRADSARKTITWAIIGLIIIFLAFAIINFLALVTGLECIKNFGFSSCQVQ